MIKYSRVKKKLIVPTGLGNGSYFSYEEAYQDGYRKGYNKGYAEGKADNGQMEG